MYNHWIGQNRSNGHSRRSKAARIRFFTPFLLLLLLAPAFWIAQPHTAESRLALPAPYLERELARPDSAFVGTAANPKTAFPEEDAGFSVYYRASAPTDSDSSNEPPARLDIAAITTALVSSPDTNDTVRAGSGNLIAIGINYGIVAVPALPALAPSSVSATTINVYYDTAGWIVAYLPADAPDAGIWRYESGAAPLDSSIPVKIINAVLTASDADASSVGNSDVDYYHWRHPEYDTFLLFVNSTVNENPSAPATFVIPPTIQNIRASAAVLVTQEPAQGESATASLLVDNAAAITTNAAAAPHSTSDFTLTRPADQTTLHKMTLESTTGYSAIGVLTLLYDKPGS